MPPFEHPVEGATPVDRRFASGSIRRTGSGRCPASPRSRSSRKPVRAQYQHHVQDPRYDHRRSHGVHDRRTGEHTVATFESPGTTSELHSHDSETDFGAVVVQRADYESGDSILERVIEPVATVRVRESVDDRFENSRVRLSSAQSEACPEFRLPPTRPFRFARDGGGNCVADGRGGSGSTQRSSSRLTCRYWSGAFARGCAGFWSLAIRAARTSPKPVSRARIPRQWFALAGGTENGRGGFRSG